VHLLVVVTADKGLCGGLELQHRARRAPGPRARSARRQDGQAPAPSAARAAATCSASTANDRRSASTPARRQARTASTKPSAIAQELHRRCSTAGEFDVASTSSTPQFKSAHDAGADAAQLLPPSAARRARRLRPSRRGRTNTSPTRGRTSSTTLLPRYVDDAGLSARCSRTLASEQGARMTAMDSATRNAGEMIKKLTLQLQPQPPGRRSPRN